MKNIKIKFDIPEGFELDSYVLKHTDNFGNIRRLLFNKDNICKGIIVQNYILRDLSDDEKKYAWYDIIPKFLEVKKKINKHTQNYV